MKIYSFSEFKIITSIEEPNEIPFILTHTQYKYFTKDLDSWAECLKLIEANGFNCVYIVHSLTDIWSLNNV